SLMVWEGDQPGPPLIFHDPVTAMSSTAETWRKQMEQLSTLTRALAVKESQDKADESRKQEEIKQQMNDRVLGTISEWRNESAGSTICTNSININPRADSDGQC